MRTPLKLMLAAALMVTAVAAFASPADDQVARAFAAFNAAFNKGDAKAVAGFYTRDAIVLPPSHDVVNSPADIEKFFAGMFTNHVTGHMLQPFKVIQVGDTLVVASKWSANGRDEKGNATQLSGLATHVFQKQADKSYKLKLHTFN